MPRIVPLIPIDLDIRRHLCFDFKGIMAAEQALSRFWGRDYYFLEALQGILDSAALGNIKKLSMVNLSVVVWQGCRHEDPQLTLDQVQEALPHIGDGPALAHVVSAVIAAWDAGSQQTEPTEEVPNDTTPLDGSIGVSAGPLLASTSA